MRNLPSDQRELQESESQQKQQSDSDVIVPDYFAWKILWSRALALMLLVLFAPIIFVLLIVVRCTSRGPGLFRQIRVGKDGKEFEILKIRTMCKDAEEESGAVLCKPGDARITWLGKILRFLHLDELPQLINVVRGEMCLIGPRPERPEIIKENELRERVPGFVDRTKVLPGVTGLAQINLPADQSPECVLPKVKLDLEYIATASLVLDTRILLCTLLRMFGIRHGHAVRLFGLGRQVVLGKLPEKKKKNILRRFVLQGTQWESVSQQLPTPAHAAAAVQGSVDPVAVATESSNINIAEPTEIDDLQAEPEFGSPRLPR